MAFGLLSGIYLGYMAVHAMNEAGFPLELSFPAVGAPVAVVAGIRFDALRLGCPRSPPK